MKRSELFKKYYKHPEHDYELSETMSHTIEGLEADIAFIFSGRNRGKSFEISSQCIADSYYDKIQFAYVRRNDATNYEIEQYFEDKKECAMSALLLAEMAFSAINAGIFALAYWSYVDLPDPYSCAYSEKPGYAKAWGECEKYIAVTRIPLCASPIISLVCFPLRSEITS